MYAPFVISGILEEVLANKVAITNTNILCDALNEHLSLNNYGDGIEGIAFIYVVTSPEDEIHEECFSYSRKKKELYIQMRLPFTEVKNATVPETLQMMATKYLQTMEDWLPKKKIPHFDGVRFVEDVKRLFEEEGWLKVGVLV